MRASCDLLVFGASEAASARGSEALGGLALGRAGALPGAALAIQDGKLAALGSEDELRARFEPAQELDARGGTLLPGLVDAHTHPVFAGTREAEFEQRTRGASYVEIAAAGGGILSSVSGVRAAGREELLRLLLLRLDRFLELGTTTVEAKTGYGLSLADELKCLEVIDAARRMHPVEVVPTFLGAHDVPAEYRSRRDEYVTLVCEEMLPRVAERRLAEYCDVFVERQAFGIEEARSILERARALGLRLRLHAEQLSRLGGAELAAQVGAASADHLEFVDERGMDALLAAGVVPVLCPIVPLYLRVEREAPARAMVTRGLAPAISTDFNPGSCMVQSLPLALSWAALRYRFSAAECLTAATLNAAASLGRGARLGTLEPGKQADVICLDAPNHAHLVYEQGRNLVRWVLKAGRLVHERGEGWRYPRPWA